MNIEYLSIFDSVKIRYTAHGDNRSKYTGKYSWSVPTEEALHELGKISPLVEIGAGSGYWAHLLRERGYKILPIDKHPRESNHYNHKKTWVDVYEGDESILHKMHSSTNLFLCWPPYNDSMATNCLKMFRGRKVAYIGEGPYGCTGNEEFHDILEDKWDLDVTVYIPQWEGIHDSLYIYNRR